MYDHMVTSVRTYKRRVLKFLGEGRGLVAVVLAGTLVSPLAHARNYEDNSGYIDTVSAERAENSKELKIVDNPDARPSLQNRIFNEELMREFRKRYEDRFGSTDALRTYYSPNKYDVYSGDESTIRQTVQNDNDAKKSYANYMLRRTAEYHAENYFKSDPELNNVWKVKEAVSHASAGSKNYKVKAGYNFGANLIEMNLLTPYVNTRVDTQLSKANNNDNVVVVSHNITPTVGIEGRYQYSRGILSVVGSKTITPSLGANLTLTKGSYNYSLYSTVREDIALAGMTYNF